MTCADLRPLLHAFADGELDAGHALRIETHVSGCQHCAAELRNIRELREALSAGLCYSAPPRLRQRIEAALPVRNATATDRRSLLKGAALGAALSAVAASGIIAVVLQRDDLERMSGDALSAHLRSLQADHLTDVLSSDQHTVKPWFNGRLDVSPPVFDLAAQGFTLIGGRLDYIDGRPAAAIVYKRRAHVINLFVLPAIGAAPLAQSSTTLQGFNARRWRDHGFDLLAVSDLAMEELHEFVEKFEAELRKV